MKQTIILFGFTQFILKYRVHKQHTTFKNKTEYYCNDFVHSVHTMYKFLLIELPK
jgi:hypothetical protein